MPDVAEESIVRSAETKAALEHRFSAADEALLERVQRACFLYFWNEVGSPAKLVKDRKKSPVSSIAAVGFQLAALPIGVERGWITREQGRERALTVLDSLSARNDNRRFGVFLHYPDFDTGGMSRHGFEIVASTVDHALLLAGALTAGAYFEGENGGEIGKRAARIDAETDWKAFAVGPDGLLCMGWRPDKPEQISGRGRFLEHHWWNASDEERLIYFLAAGAGTPAHAIPPERYYRLKRPIKRHGDMPPHVVSWPGTLFTYFFSHCYIDYRSMDADDPAAFGSPEPRVDWFENSRRAVLTHRQRCIEQSSRFKTLSADRWGLSACAARDGYIVPEVRPNIRDHDEWFDGTVAPYAAASAIMFAPAESLAAIRAFMELKDRDGRPFVWRDPSDGGYGFVDSFNLDQRFASDDYVGIDQGPMLLAIENARTGLIWKLFMRSATARRAAERLKLGARVNDSSFRG